MCREQLPGSISLSGMEVPCRVGVLPGEADRPQPVRVAVTVNLDLAAAAATDALRDALDYRDLVETVRAVAGRRKYRLLESLGGALLDEILAMPPVRRVQLDLQKVHPPLGPAVGPIVVRLTQTREARAG